MEVHHSPPLCPREDGHTYGCLTRQSALARGQSLQQVLQCWGRAAQAAKANVWLRTNLERYNSLARLSATAGCD